MYPTELHQWLYQMCSILFVFHMFLFCISLFSYAFVQREMSYWRQKYYYWPAWLFLHAMINAFLWNLYLPLRQGPWPQNIINAWMNGVAIVIISITLMMKYKVRAMRSRNQSQYQPPPRPGENLVRVYSRTYDDNPEVYGEGL
jgi:hypothetical protein